MYHVKDNAGKHVRCDTIAEAELVQACWYKAGSEVVEIEELKNINFKENKK